MAMLIVYLHTYMKAKKSFGQHFLTQDPIAERLASALHTDGCGAIVEVGPGKGILTKFLLKQGISRRSSGSQTLGSFRTTEWLST